MQCLVAEKERREKETLGTGESGASNTSTNNDNVSIGGVSRSTFSVSRRCCCGDAVHCLGSRLSNNLFLTDDEAINHNDSRENRDDDRSQRVLIQSHRHR